MAGTPVVRGDEEEPMEDSALQDKLEELATELEVPGVSVGVLADGQERYAYHGLTSVENPLPVDENTLFQFGSTGKTYTATAIMRLVDQGRVSLEAPVRTYLPDFRLKDPDVAEKVTVLHLLNHTAGWEGDLMTNTGDGDDALERYVALMADLEQVTPLGTTVSYNNASLSVAGLIVARQCGTTYEQAIRDLLFSPLGLDQTWFFANDIMTRRFSVGHTHHDQGKTTVNRPWALPRGNAPAGGMSATSRDLIAWARFHLGDGTAPDGTRLLSKELLDRMKEPTADMRGSALGDYVGISWLLRDVDGVRLVGHGGTTNGQYSDFVMVPERGFALTSMANCGPNGSQLNHSLSRWALEHYLGVIDKDPEPIVLGDDVLASFAGRYETIAATCHITVDSGRLLAKIDVKPEMRKVLSEAGEEIPDDEPPFVLGLLHADGNDYVIAEGPAKGMKGYFVRDRDGSVTGVHLGGRLATRVGVTA
ncbi:MAG TPA: serine hydrolase domain-containing protein [Acidimicrobiales bacterium]|nr:serine hydrolase domain-containing protein [Acidimicrobiales bacterium]